MITRRLLLSLAAFGALALSGCERMAPPHHFNSFDLTGAKYAQGFSLPDFDGQPRTLADFRGKVTIVFFGYTQCPDACPTTMAELSGILKTLGPDAVRVQVVFITVDPSRDSAALLKNYVTNFRSDFLALRPDDAQVPALIKDFKLVVEKVPGKTAGTYTIDHTAGSYIYDPQGHIRLFASQSLDPALLTDDIRTLLAEKP
jgi:protein SCO1/2